MITKIRHKNSYQYSFDADAREQSYRDYKGFEGAIRNFIALVR
jgi:hypothetical protein